MYPTHACMHASIVYQTKRGLAMFGGGRSTPCPRFVCSRSRSIADSEETQGCPAGFSFLGRTWSCSFACSFRLPYRPLLIDELLQHARFPVALPDLSTRSRWPCERGSGNWISSSQDVAEDTSRRDPHEFFGYDCDFFFSHYMKIIILFSVSSNWKQVCESTVET